MYQGKFSSNNAEQGSINADLIAQRNAAKLQKEQRRQAGQRPAPAKPKIPAAAAPKATANPEAKAPAKKTTPVSPLDNMGKSSKKPIAQPEALHEKKKSTKGTRVFYTIYFACIAVFVVATLIGLQWLKGWLADYEAAQPTTKANEVFQQLFENPDWRTLYVKSGVQDTAYEGVDEYVSYMTEKVGSQKLEYEETSAGLTKGHKYLVRLGKEKVATFTLVGDSKFITDIVDWQLGDIDLFFGRDDGYLIQKLNGHTAYVNGTALDDSFTIQIATTKAEEYLPAGTSGIRTDIQRIDNLMAKPTVTVTDENGEQMEVIYDEQTGTFIEQSASNTIGPDEENVVLEAARIYGQYMIKRVTRGDVAKYFDPTHEPYNLIVKSELFSTTNNGCRFSDEVVSEYSRYTDNIFSARVSLTMNVIRTDGTIKDYPIDTTLFFTRKDEKSKWMVFEMTNEDIQQPVGKVRLTFVNDGVELFSSFVDTNAHSIQTPTVTVPEGKVFSGWGHNVTDENGRKTFVIEFGATEDGVVTVSAGTTLTPMTLTAYFENAASTNEEG